jgi:transcription-repair coupling factor (superfamily II helicase)
MSRAELDDRTLQRWMSPRELKALSKQSGDISLGHLPAAAQAFVLAGLARLAPKKTFLALASGVKTQEELANDLDAWSAPNLFFPQVDAPIEGALPDPEASAERLSALTKLTNGFTGVVLTTVSANEQRLPAPDALQKNRIKLVKNTHLDREALLTQLQDAGYTRETQVQGRGQFSVRGAVVDIYSWDASRPLRTEWLDEELISLREFDVDIQRSVQTLKTAELSLAGPFMNKESDDEAALSDYLPKGFVTVHLGPEEA